MNRAQRRLKHKLTLAPKGTKSPFPGLVLQPNQIFYTCACRTGWMSISAKEPTESFETHVAQFTGGK